MKLIKYAIYNADDRCIGHITANDIKSASKKLFFKYGNLAYFLRLQTSKTTEVWNENKKRIKKDKKRINEISSFSKEEFHCLGK